jgi:hypothetical protein
LPRAYSYDILITGDRETPKQNEMGKQKMKEQFMKWASENFNSEELGAIKLFLERRNKKVRVYSETDNTTYTRTLKGIATGFAVKLNGAEIALMPKFYKLGNGELRVITWRRA